MNTDSLEETHSLSTSQWIPLSRLMIYSFVGVLLLPIITWMYLSSSLDTARADLLRLKETKLEIIKLIREQYANRSLMMQYADRDPFFLAKNVETYKTLHKEEASIKSLIKQGGMPELLQQERRLKFLVSADNSFSFVESAVTISPFFKETTETQNKPVEMDENDLVEILSRIEGGISTKTDNPSLNNIILTRPQMFITEASLEKKKGYDREVWALSIKLVKRMYTHYPVLLPNDISSSNFQKN